MLQNAISSCSYSFASRIATIPITITTGGECKVKLHFFCVNLPERNMES